MERYNKVKQGNTYIREHRAIAAQMIGRPLSRSEVVHHIDNDGNNNNVNNLIVFSSQAEHQSFHQQDCNPEILMPNGDGTFRCSFMFELKQCKQCGKDFQPKASKNANLYCSRSCSSLASRKVKRPDKDTLQQEIDVLGYEGTGRKYGVSGNAIRKWLK